MGLDTLCIISAIVYNGNFVSSCLLCFPALQLPLQKASSKGKGLKYFPFSIDPFFGGKAKQF